MFEKPSLKKWRTSAGLNLRQAAKMAGIGTSSFSEIERGGNFPSPRTIAKIEGMTGGVITVIHHWNAWLKAHPVDFVEFRAAGRSAAKEHRPPAKPKTKPRRA